MRPRLIHLRHALTVLVAVVAASAPLRAQTFGEVEQRRSTSQAYFVHVLPGEATVVVSVWGTVQRPGTYEVSAGMDMGEVLSLAGGPILAPIRQTTETDLTRETRVRLYRIDGAARTRLYDATLGEMVAAPAAYPTLAEGDVVEVTTFETERRRWTWRDTATLGGLAASALIAISQFVIIIR